MSVSRSSCLLLAFLALSLAACGREEAALAVPTWARVSPEQIEAAKEAGVPVAIQNSIGMRFVLIPAGKFTMGSPVTEEGHRRWETPHEVQISKPYYLAVHETTNAQYRRYASDHNSGRFLNEDSQPVVDLTYAGVQAFVEWLNGLERRIGGSYRLPTEAEWERACRAGTTTPYWFGLSISTDRANFGHRGWPLQAAGSGTLPVGTFPPNPWGLYDTHGNAAEWVSDWSQGTYYESSPTTDPVGPPEGRMRGVRGGAWYREADEVRSASRAMREPETGQSDTGFRLVLEVPRK